MSRLEGKALVAQGGGPTHVINQSVVGVALEARRHSRIHALYGAVHGVRGIIEEDFLDLTRETTRNLDLVGATPSSGLLSTRDKPDAEYCGRMFEVMKAHDIRFFFYVGGNDSSDTVRIVSEHAKAANYDLRAIHIPKTIDNDLEENDHCPGFGSAARYVANAFTGASLDNRALGGIYIGIVMGRHAGFLTAAAAMANTYDDDGPHLIYLPERAFDTDKFLADVRSVYQKHGCCVIAVSEGISDSSGTPVITKLMGEERDAHGNVQLSGTGALGDLLADTIKEKLGIKRVRADTFGYLQRCLIGSASDVDQAEAREVGEAAVRFAMLGDADGSVAIRRPVPDYRASYDLVPLQNVAGKTRHMPDAFINAAGNHVTPAFRDWCRPLLGSDMPQAHRFRAPAVPKILKA
ncbi:MAG: 6-phosphofructokinase [Akkermansiaceae bacterium]|nr:6-phosphofructokinase [Akkermansiaceae bacterium]MCP5548759.1 6-phosphofructokinase [Akkermansiaceae bacterium]